MTELDSLELTTALDQLITEERVEDPVLAKMEILTCQVEDHTLFALVAKINAVLGLSDVVSLCPSADTFRANLLCLQAEASGFINRLCLLFRYICAE